MEENQVYFAEVSERLINSCDIVLKLDDGSALPAHSKLLHASPTSLLTCLMEDPWRVLWDRLR